MTQAAKKVGASRAIPIGSHTLRGLDSKMSTLVEHRTVKDAFPDVDPGIRPTGSKILVQLRTPMTVTKGGLHLSDDTRETEMWNEQTAIVRYIGPTAYRYPEDGPGHKAGDFWTEGAWCKIGDFVRIPKYHSDRIVVSVGGRSEDLALFVTLKCSEVIALVTGDPLSIKSFV